MTSRLDRMVARLLTQRACLNRAAALVAGIPGPVLELGLGKGRTWSHLCGLFPGRRLIAFDHDLHAPEELRPTPADLVLGDLRVTLPDDPAALGGPAALIHADIGTADGRGELGAPDAELARFIGDVAVRLLAPGGILAGDRDMTADGAVAGLTPLPLPDPGLPADVTPWPYYLLRRDA